MLCCFDNRIYLSPTIRPRSSVDYVAKHWRTISSNSGSDNPNGKLRLPGHVCPEVKTITHWVPICRVVTAITVPVY